MDGVCLWNLCLLKTNWTFLNNPHSWPLPLLLKNRRWKDYEIQSYSSELSHVHYKPKCDIISNKLIPISQYLKRLNRQFVSLPHRLNMPQVMRDGQRFLNWLKKSVLLEFQDTFGLCNCYNMLHSCIFFRLQRECSYFYCFTLEYNIIWTLNGYTIFY